MRISGSDQNAWSFVLVLESFQHTHTCQIAIHHRYYLDDCDADLKKKIKARGSTEQCKASLSSFFHPFSDNANKLGITSNRVFYTNILLAVFLDQLFFFKSNYIGGCLQTIRNLYQGRNSLVGKLRRT